MIKTKNQANCTGQLIQNQLNLSLSTNSFIYVTERKKEGQIMPLPLNTASQTITSELSLEENNDIFPLFFNNLDVIYVPRKAERSLKRSVPERYLKAIDNDKNIAVEKCLVVLSNLSSTFFEDKKNKQLHSKILHEQTKKGNDNTRIYPKVIKALMYNTTISGGFIVTKKNADGSDVYLANHYSKSYSLTQTYLKSGLTEYRIKNKQIIEVRKKHFYNQLAKANENIIARNLISLYAKLDLPNQKDLLEVARGLTSQGYRNRKGKILTFLNKHPKSYFKESDKRTFVEENIKLFNYLTKNSYMIPHAGDVKSGGRVVDSFTLMPSWIRKLVKIDGETIVEIDFKAFHPNIAISIYQGSKHYLTHEKVSDESNIKKEEVKVQHLSFFNETLRGMKRNVLYDYYQQSEPLMLEKVIDDKKDKQYAHRITSMKMFAKEVEIMTEIIKRLNAIDIYVGYVYDALFCKESVAEKVKEIMNEVVIEFGVYTVAEF